MNRPFPITIVGGGLAGLTLGIALRQRNISVRIQEALRYPRHRVCGEFICGRGLESLQRLGLLHLLQEAGGRPAQSFALFMGATALPPCDIPSYRPVAADSSPIAKALCVSRWTLDATLAAEFERLGGIIQYERGTVKDTPEGTIDATGRKMPQRRPPKAPPGTEKWRWTGIKAHARNVTLSADLELHLLQDGYVGLCRLAKDEVNVCALFRHRSALPDLAKNWQKKLTGSPSLKERLEEAHWVEDSFCAVAGLDFRPAYTPSRIGDALGMLPPFTGNGMSAAFESAELASGPLAAYASGAQSWEEACHSIMLASRARFERRHFWGRLIQPIFFHPATRGPLFSLIKRFPLLTTKMFQLTR